MKLNKEELDVLNELRSGGGSAFIGQLADKLKLAPKAVKVILVRLEGYGLVNKGTLTRLDS
jgi:DNA-binding MarR family transcriptional regulator